MLHEENLKTFKVRGGEWYDFYSNAENARSEKTLVIIATTSPNPLIQRKSIYSRKVLLIQRPN